MIENTIVNDNCPTVPVLDHGYVILRNLSGPTRRTDTVDDNGDLILRMFDADDTDSANSARMSFGQTDSGRTREEDIKLANYLMRNMHTSPFEQVQVWLQMKLPIFIARQFVRHRTVRLNEISGRYKQLPAEWYIPEVHDRMLQTEDKKQGGRLIDINNPAEVQLARKANQRLNTACEVGYKLYLDDIADGIAMEQARLHLHLNHYTEWLWNQDLHNLMHLMRLRLHSHAQREAQAYAKAIYALLKAQLPATMDLFDRYYRGL